MSCILVEVVLRCDVVIVIRVNVGLIGLIQGQIARIYIKLAKLIISLYVHRITIIISCLGIHIDITVVGGLLDIEVTTIVVVEN